MEDVITPIDQDSDAEPAAAVEVVAYPEGEYAIVEILGHQTLVGRVQEVERFGASMLQIEPILKNIMLDPVLQGGASIYRFSPCSAKDAFKNAPQKSWQLPSAVSSLLPDEVKDNVASQYLSGPVDPFDPNDDVPF